MSPQDSKRDQRSSTLTLAGKQLRALLYKDFLVRKFHFISTFFELLSPLLLIFAFAALYSSTVSNDAPPSPHDDSSITGNEKTNPKPTLGPIIYNDTQYRLTWNPAEDFSSKSNFENFSIYFSPNNTFTRRLLAPLIDAASNVSETKIAVTAFRTQAEMNTALTDRFSNSTNSYFAYRSLIAIAFQNVDDLVDGWNHGGRLSYEIRVPSDSGFLRESLAPYPYKMNQKPIQDLSHIVFYSNFWRLQAYVNREYLKISCSEIGNSRINCSDDQIFAGGKKEIHINRMPYPKYRNPVIDVVNMIDLVAFCLPLCYVLVCPLIVKRITDEKSTKAKELLRLIGMSDAIFYLAHFINYLILIIIHTVAITLILYCFPNPLFHLSSPAILIIGMIIWAAQLILFSMFITTVFNRPVLATIVTVIVWVVLCSVIFQNLVPSINGSIDIAATNPQRILSCLTPSGSLIWLISIMGAWENNGNGLTFDKLGSPSIAYQHFTVLHVWLLTLVSYFIYVFFIWYLDNVWPFQHGVPKRPWFLFTADYWRTNKSAAASVARNGSLRRQLDDKNFEPEPSDLEVAISIERVRKTFNGGAKVAVNDLCMNIYRNQLTVLLGHNGAGKTTTMNMITGMYPSTSGRILVNGFDIFAQTKAARRSIGLCPQENIIFNELTVSQHLRLFARLKDFPTPLIEQEVDHILSTVKLADKKNKAATSLSGGMKRKLSLGIALIGGTETLILDEPTSGMDPDARRSVWDLLLDIRRQRTILLTTHYMEEADLLGDRIAIMNEGRLRCAGAPFFLKNAFGNDYRLRIAKLKTFNSADFVRIIQRYIPETRLNTEIETEVVYTLNTSTIDKQTLFTNLPKLFEDIEANKANYGIDSCGLSYTTLEDVFLTVGSDIDLHHNQAMNGISDEMAEQNNETTMNGVERQKILLTDCSNREQSIVQQFIGLLLKRFHFARRYWTMMILQILIPAAIIIFAMILQNATSAIGKVTKVKLDLSNPETIYGPQTRTFYYGDQTIGDAYRRLHEVEFEATVANIAASNSTDPPKISKSILDDLDRQHDGRVQDYIQKYLYAFGDPAAKSNNDRENAFVSWINYEQYHSLPLAINAIFESLLRSILPDSMRSNATISVISAPLPVDTKTQEALNIVGIIVPWALTCLIFMPIAFPFLAASYVLYPIKENASKAKLLQLMTGLSPFTFWFANFVFDLLNHLLAITFLFLIIVIFDTQHIFTGAYSSGSGMALYILLFTFGVSTIPVAYFFSYRFVKPSSGFVFMIVLFLVIGFIGNIALSAVDLLINSIGLSLPAVSNFWSPFFLTILRFIPIFSMLFGYQKVQKLSMFAKLCAENFAEINATCARLQPNSTNIFRGCCANICGDRCYQTANPFAMTAFGAGPEIIYMLVTGLVCFMLITLYESYKQQVNRFFSFDRLLRRKKSESLAQPRLRIVAEDSDVAAECMRVQNESSRHEFSDLLTVEQLTKRFAANFTAVDRLTFGVHAQECFGLLGVNGAGKTTTFSMLTGDLLPTSGTAHMHQGAYSLLENLRQFQQNIGYCPQFDALLDKLTGVETLFLFARLRGIPAANIARDVNNLIRMVGLEAHASRRTDTYSGGNRRKLSIAMALIGNPALLFLDEPSAGVDPAARRKIWKTLGYLKRNFNCSIVLTSHSMEECEALCSRIGIMVNGRFRCLGSTQHLRSKYGQGYSVQISLKPARMMADPGYVDTIQNAIAQQLPTAALKDFHQLLLHYHIEDRAERWSTIFTKMSALNERFDFQNYFVSDTTLEQIFIMFARNQEATQNQSLPNN